MDHAAYQKRLRSLPEAALRYAIKDCQEALDANPETRNADRYLDEQHYCHMELARRTRRARRAR